MASIQQILVEFEILLKKVQAPIYEKLQDGLASDYVDRLLAETGINNDELKKLYAWKNGISYDSGWKIGDFDFFSFGLFLSLQDSIEHYVTSKSQKIWRSGLFPIFTNGGGDFILLDTNDKNKTKGMLLLHAPSLLLSDKPESIYDSLNTFFTTILECYNVGAYKMIEGSIEIDDDLEHDVSKRLNPKSKYWIQ